MSRLVKSCRAVYIPPMATKIGRPPKLGDVSMVHLRLPDRVIDGLDAWVEQAAASTPGGSGITRSDLIRDILARAVAERGTPEARRYAEAYRAQAETEDERVGHEAFLKAAIESAAPWEGA